ncbi:MAG TPA: molecular chaperone DnaK [Candidatus Wildermuthbacteria bacterium]|uniref:Chaperone protein DnaK n=1 Tax=Candidatus Yanofskybacteria bacterium GW2011_GWC1_48_11 TaxID=1619027 RepID=A0A837IPV3_9BACT|nr:MAG: chaperone protein DnaK, molecular chaperone DnaK [Candidatus Yanofskybacteria bacterium GW2011_GWC1_48_11]KKW04729.1 MAG: Chaperone protein DnaK [Parcubacteria group bacterium GW2011_GWB1_49_12]KKW08970.1 MAG: Chaperone protein DnaK [Parcubacteria group bacterium GW2011_GWA1_49_26]KKW14261.1 MAG: Chaperone protein DnaK [Parcubacteria group bacterium GW2011_GWA2_50_10]OHA61025.1 MAG: molecular chaperone DnaK [Candidatus Wildermuthbacteria bacterium GWA1_49_26]OHA66055.1 MAG: molecular c
MAKIVGIDLGTTLSEIAVVEGGEPRIIENREGGRTTPSVVALAKNREILVGVQARRQQITNPRNTIFQVKRLIGRRFLDPEVQRDKKLLPYEIREAADGGVEIKMGDLPDGKTGKWYKPPEISAMVLRKLKQDAEEKLGEKITEAIITVPAYFDDSQRKATKVAGEIAGLEVKRVINEPTAAALAYGLDKKKEERIIVYDFGGGTFDISILEVSPETIEVKATGGDTHLGGEDFDQKIMDWLTSQYKKDEGIDLSKDVLALQRLKEAAERAKVELSTSMETEINLPFITSDASGPKHLLYKLSRAQLEGLVQEYIDKSITLVKQTLQEAKLSPQDIQEVVLVGGQTRMPAMQEAVKRLFQKEPNKSINPDEVVAIGAAIQGGILRGDVRDVLLLDVTPLSLGIETLGGVNTILISKNTTIPTTKSQIFSTAADNQTSVEVHVVQGERPLAQDNKSLGRFILDGIPPAPRGMPQVEVSFDIDANGILNVTAKDKATAKSQSIRIEGSTGISAEEVERMKKEAELHAMEDRKRQELIEVRNAADTLIYTSEKALKDAGDKVGEDVKKEVGEKLEALRKAKDGDNIEEIKQATEQLSKVLQKIGAAMYQNPPAGGQAQNPGDQKEEDKK